MYIYIYILGVHSPIILSETASHLRAPLIITATTIASANCVAGSDLGSIVVVVPLTNDDSRHSCAAAR